MLRHSPWRPRRVAVVIAGAVVGAVLSCSGPAAADPSDQPGGTSGVLDSRALDELQKRAAEVQTGLQAQQGQVVAARDAMTRAQQDVAAAQKVADDARAQLAGYQQAVAGYAWALYREGGGITPLTVLLDSGDPGDVLSAMSFLDVVDAHAAAVVGAAETMRRSAQQLQQRAQAALDQARARQDAAAARMAGLEKKAAAVTDELGAALDDVDEQLAQLQKKQVDVDTRTAANWQVYVDQLTSAGIVPPGAAQLQNPAGGLPAGLVPVAASGGVPPPGLGRAGTRP
jgi:peptidoglycan hydrolase CwlO-like protein